MLEVVIYYAREARNDLKKLDRPVARRIAKKIERNATLDNPLQPAKALRGELTGLYRYRIGNYRVVFEQTDDGRLYILTILAVQHRKDI